MEQEIVQFRGKIRETESREATERAAADALLASMRAEKVDLTKPENFAKVDEAFKRADGSRDEIATLRGNLARLMDIAGEKADAPRDSSERRSARDFVERYIR